jgi:hypothetical protein
MPSYINETQSFRHRGFEDHEKLDCNGNPTRIMIFGDGPAPVDSQGQTLKLLWDNDVNQVITVSKHVDSTQA